MLQQIIQVGNSIAVTIPKDFAREVGLSAGQKVNVETDRESEMLTVALYGHSKKQDKLTPEFLQWLDGFNAKYKHVLTELAKK